VILGVNDHIFISHLVVDLRLQRAKHNPGAEFDINCLRVAAVKV
jgi:hypothetical protein